MFQDMSKALNQSIGPFKALVDIQTKMLEELTRQQMMCTKACIDATLKQTQQMQHCASTEDLIKSQQAYALQLEQTLKQANDLNIAALKQARESVEHLANDAFDAFAPK
ncbi:phasin family protein [Amphritea sp. 1_MG-2023]|uniref:phasin family protein n=1 Tax=Amphritea sp. 1_MG-2023 TaxID=3062670 RepID=UPI0026E1FB20|nr:phasin family protein [Amphritea sp. 1_MG-2023]MDO6562716.1 phasin family protein [Amphritea sp. 1_MG-2023]